MFESLLRGYDKVVRGLFKSRGGVIENEGESPIPGVTKLPGAADLIGAIFVADCQRQQMEYETRTSMTGFDDALNIGTVNGISIISFSKRK